VGPRPTGPELREDGAVSGIVLFDLDNTLIDRDRAFRRWAAQFLARRNLDPDELSWLVSADDDGKASRQAFFGALKARYGLPESQDALVLSYQEESPGFYQPEPPILGAVQALRSAGWKTAVITNGPASQENKIRSAGLDVVLDAWCISGVEGVAKPERRIFEEAARRSGADLEGWMVGDTPEIDIQGGITSGLRTIWMARGRPWDVVAYAPDVVADDIVEATNRILEAT
jgi:HAD superfamily hydrolase (TIGR01549 family)